MDKQPTEKQGATTPRKWGWVAAWVTLAIVVFYINALVPKLWDDWGAGLHSWREVFSYAYNKYFSWNSRIFGNFFDVIMGKSPNAVADLLSTMAFMVMLLCMLMLATGKSLRDAMHLWPMAVVLWFVIVSTVPTFGECFLWHCGISYYLFPFVFVWLFLLACRPAAWGAMQSGSCERKFSLAQSVGLCLVAIPAGWSMENLGIVNAMLALGIAYFAKGSPNRKVLFVAGGIALLGWVAMYLSPGSQVRMQLILDQHEMTVRGQTPIETAGAIYTLPEKILHMLRLHLRAVPLYIATVILIGRLRKRGLWNRKEWLFFCVCVGAGLMCQGAFFGTVIAPAPRAELVTFLFIAIACLRVIWLAYRASRHRVRWNAAIVILALLPCLCLSNLRSMHRQIEDYMVRLEAARGKGQGVVLPYWRQQCDPVFGFISCFVNPYSKDGYWNKTVAQAMDVPWVEQDNRRCTYDVTMPGARVSALTREMPGGGSTTFRVEFAGDGEACGGRYLHIATPISKKKRCTSLPALAEWFSPRTGDSATGWELQQEGRDIITFEIPPGGTVEWKKSYGLAGDVPEFWFAVSANESTDTASFHLAAPTPATEQAK